MTPGGARARGGGPGARVLAVACALAAACGARSSLEHAAPWVFDGGSSRGADLGAVAEPGADVPTGDLATRDDGAADAHDARDVGVEAACAPVDDRCGAQEACGNGADDDCDGAVDEGCACEPGAVQACFRGPPGRRGVGACRDGAQRCVVQGAAGRWGPCEGGIGPGDDVCNALDNRCDGCSRARRCPITCPGPGDARVPLAEPLRDYALRGRLFYDGPAAAWAWRVEGGPCEAVGSRASFTVRDGTAETAVFHPTLSGDYTVTLTVTRPDGTTVRCVFVVTVAGPGLRVELCWPENLRVDLDLYLHSPRNTLLWFQPGGSAHDPVPEASCNWSNCEATIRGAFLDGTRFPRADWGFAASSLDACVHGPLGAAWRAEGHCPNPRLDVDNNLTDTRVGRPENINVDAPRDGDTYRVMVQNFSGSLARPVVNVYCAGRRVGTYGAAPDEVADFQGARGNDGVGAMWRVVDVVTRVNAAGVTTGCALRPLHPPARTAGYHVTRNDRRY